MRRRTFRRAPAQAQRRRSITIKQAITCELGAGIGCSCRCGGGLHGAKRFSGGDRVQAARFLVALPVGDPHRPTGRALKRVVAATYRQLSLF